MALTDVFPASRTEIAGVSIVDMAREFGTPTYVYDSAKILQRIEELKQFDVIRYAQKANSNLAILDLVRRHGVCVDAVSAGEIHRALAAGYETAGDETAGAKATECEGTGKKSVGKPDPIVFTADIFDRAALDLVVEQGVHCNVGSPDMIAQYGQAVDSGEITLRLNPGFGHGHSQKTNTGGEQSKHGIWHDQLEESVQLAQKHGLTVTGLHMHIGSGTDLEHLAQVCGAMRDAARTVGPSITTISAGGGLPVIYQEGETEVDVQQYFELWDAVRCELQTEFGHAISLEIEPGRFLAAESGYLLAEIRAIKKMGQNTFYVVDAGFNNLARPILYGAYHPMSITSANGRKLNERADVIVGGPLCESGDIFTQEEGGFVCSRKLPVAEIGDILVIECAGAYGFVMSSNYNSKPMTAEVLVSDGKAELIRRRQTFQDLYKDEIIPGK